MAVGDFSFRFSSAQPSGWTARTIVTPRPSAVGPVNALAQNPISAAALRTTPSTLNDPVLGSRQYANPYTGGRQPVASSSVYAMSEVPPFLSQAVEALNTEQTMRRALQAEWNDRIFRQAQGAGPDAYLWHEALRAASVTPGASVAFGQSVQNPAFGRAAQTNAAANQAALEARTRPINELSRARAELAALENRFDANWPSQRAVIDSLRARVFSLEGQANASLSSPTILSGWSAAPITAGMPTLTPSGGSSGSWNPFPQRLGF